MRLKIWTTLVFVASLALLGASSAILGPRPDPSDRAALAKYGAQGLTLFGVVSVGLLVAAFLATRIMRNVREQFAKEALANFQNTLKQEEKQDGSVNTGSRVDGESDPPLA
jgi:hypothetical protein